MPRASKTYPVGHGPVYLRVAVGEGQLGTTGALLDDRVLSAISGQYALGRGAALAGRTLFVASTVSQTNPRSTLTRVTYTLSGGPQPLTFELEETVAQPGQTVDFEVRISLVSG